MDKETRKSLIDIVRSCDTVQFCTFSLKDYPETRTIINWMNRENNCLHLHFITYKTAHKLEQVKKNNHVCLYYFNPTTRMAMRLFGRIEEIFDREKKDKFWQDDMKQFGYKDKDDERYRLMEFTPKIYKYYANNIEYTGDIAESEI